MSQKYAFILGKFPEISMKEVCSYLNARNIGYNVLEFMNEQKYAYTIIETNQVLNLKKVIEELGGTIKIGQVVHETSNHSNCFAYMGENIQKRKKQNEPCDSGELEKIFDDKEFLDKIFYVRPNPKFVGVSIYPKSKNQLKNLDYRRMIESYGRGLARILKAYEGTKYISVIKPNSVAFNSNSFIIPSEAWRMGFHKDNIEFLITMGIKNTYFSVTEAIYNIPYEKERGDRLIRPSGWKYAMRPRLAKMLVNLSEAKEGDTLFDPFCGIGTILQEAIFNNINVIGSDINSTAIEFAKMNLDIAKEKNNKQKILSTVIVEDARNLSLNDENVDAIATEPALGPSITKRPSREVGEDIIRELFPLYRDSLKEMHRVLKKGKKISIAMPCIQTSYKFCRINLSKISSDIGFRYKRVGIEGESQQIILREIYKLKKIA